MLFRHSSISYTSTKTSVGKCSNKWHHTNWIRAKFVLRDGKCAQQSDTSISHKDIHSTVHGKENFSPRKHLIPSIDSELFRITSFFVCFSAFTYKTSCSHQFLEGKEPFPPTIPNTTTIMLANCAYLITAFRRVCVCVWVCLTLLAHFNSILSATKWIFVSCLLRSGNISKLLWQCWNDCVYPFEISDNQFFFVFATFLWDACFCRWIFYRWLPISGAK